MWACYFGEISDSYKERWEPHTVSPEQKDPDVFDVLAWRQEIMYRLHGAANKCFSDMIQVDWGGWAYKVTKKQAIAYNKSCGKDNSCKIPKSVIDGMEEGKVYGIIDVEIY